MKNRGTEIQSRHHRLLAETIMRAKALMALAERSKLTLERCRDNLRPYQPITVIINGTPHSGRMIL